MYTYKNIENMPIGTKITIREDEELNTYIKSNDEEFCNTKDRTGFDIEGDDEDLMKSIIKIEEPTYKTTYEAKEILDEKEKEFLSNLIKMFKNKVIWISKMSYINYEYLEISYEEIAGYSEEVSLPIFKKGTMYRGMEFDKEYSLEELGL